MTFWVELYKRLKTETPKFFKKLRAVGGACMATGTAIWAMHKETDLPIPSFLISLVPYLISVGFTKVFVSSLAVVDTPIEGSEK